MYTVFVHYSTVYHGLYRLGVNVAAPAIKTKCKFLFLHFCTVWKNIDNLLHLQPKDFSEAPKSVKYQRCSFVFFNFAV